MALIRPTVVVEVELSGFGGGWTAITSDVLMSPGVVVRYGVSSSSPFDRVASTGSLSFFLNNSAGNSGATLGYYSPNNASCRSGWDLGIRCRLTLTDPNTLVQYPRFHGRIDSIDPAPGVRRQRTVAVTVVDWIDEAARWKMTPAIGEQVDRDWSTIFDAIVDEMPFAPLAVAADSGNENYPYATDTSEISKQTALTELRKLANSEFGMIFVMGSGTLRMENRHARMLTAASNWTLTEGHFQELEMPTSRDDIVNTIRVKTHPRRVDSIANVIVYNQENVIRFEIAETKRLMGQYRDQTTGATIGATEIQALVAGIDFIANTEEDGSGSDCSSNFFIIPAYGSNGARLDVTNLNGTVAFVTTLRLTGKGIYDYGETIHEATDSTSVTTYGEHAIEFDMPYQVNAEVGQAAADYLLEKMKDPLAQARTIRVAGRDETRLTQILALDISDRVTLSETVTGVNDQFIVNGVELRILSTGTVDATYTLMPVGPTLDDFFIVDSSSINGADILAPF